MQYDLERGQVPPTTDYDVCVVGGGPVGLVTAAALMARGSRVIVTEAGSAMPQPRRNRISPVEVEGEPRYGLAEGKTSRAIGGTSWLWEIDLHGVQGVRYTVIEPAVLERRLAHLRSWPLGAADLADDLDEALRHAGLDEVAATLAPQPSSVVPGLDQGRYVFGPRARFQATGLGRDIARGATLVTGAVATTFHCADDLSGRVSALELRSRTGSVATIRARTFVLAAGTIENTRLALTLGDLLPTVRANAAIGVGLMDRPRITGRLVLAPGAVDRLREFHLYRKGTTWSMQRWVAPHDQVVAGAASCSFVPMPDPGASGWWGRLEGLVHRIAIALPQLLEQRITDNAGQRIGGWCLALSRRTYRLRSALYRSALRSRWNLEWGEWHRGGAPGSSWAVTAIVEQFPDAANRIELTDDLDELGCRRVRMVWGNPVRRDGAIDASLQRAEAAVRDSGLGELSFEGIDFDAVSSCHMTGTLAMGDDPSTSATTPDGLVRGTANVYVAGMSLFPTSGHANPTLTALALGVRVARCVSERHAAE